MNDDMPLHKVTHEDRKVPVNNILKSCSYNTYIQYDELKYSCYTIEPTFYLAISVLKYILCIFPHPTLVFEPNADFLG